MKSSSCRDKEMRLQHLVTIHGRSIFEVLRVKLSQELFTVVVFEQKDINLTSRPASSVNACLPDSILIGGTQKWCFAGEVAFNSVRNSAHNLLNSGIALSRSL